MRMRFLPVGLPRRFWGRWRTASWTSADCRAFPGRVLARQAFQGYSYRIPAELRSYASRLNPRAPDLEMPLCWPKNMKNLEKVIRTFIDEAQSSDMDLCLTLADREIATAWVQLTVDSLNVSFPVTEEPLGYFKSVGVTLPAGSQSLGFEAGTYATFSHDGGDVQGLTRFVRQYFLRMFKIAAEGESVVCGQEALGPRREKPVPAPPAGRENWWDRLRERFFSPKSKGGTGSK